MSLRDASTLKTADVELILQHISPWYEILTWFIILVVYDIREGVGMSLHSQAASLGWEKTVISENYYQGLLSSLFESS